MRRVVSYHSAKHHIHSTSECVGRCRYACIDSSIHMIFIALKCLRYCQSTIYLHRSLDKTPHCRPVLTYDLPSLSSARRGGGGGGFMISLEANSASQQQPQQQQQRRAYFRSQGKNIRPNRTRAERLRDKQTFAAVAAAAGAAAAKTESFSPTERNSR